MESGQDNDDDLSALLGHYFAASRLHFVRLLQWSPSVTTTRQSDAAP